MSWLGLDIGGANLKVSDGRSFARSRSFALWKHPEQLVHEIRALIAEAPQSDHIVATMTGELADCFESKKKGVHAIIDAIDQAADGRHTRVYLTNGKLVTIEVARRQLELAASSNWHALASFSCRLLKKEQSGLLMDMGSTTTDIIVLARDGPRITGLTDTDRLAAGELVYTGVRRNPVCAVARFVPYRDQQLPVAQEMFATMLDVYLILQDLQEEPTSSRTADGRPATKQYARARLARVICADSDTFNHHDAIAMATSVANQQLDQLCVAMAQVWQAAAAPDIVVTSGEGEFVVKSAVARMGWKTKIVSLKKQLGRAASICAPAHALAVLAGERGSS